MIKQLKNVIDRIRGIRTETVDLANTAERVGSAMEDAITISVTKFDPDGSYKQGQPALYKGIIIEALTDTLPVSNNGGGYLPDTIQGRLSWSFNVVSEASQASLSNKLPITASAVVALMGAVQVSGDTPDNADENTRGLARQASQAAYDAGTVNDLYVTPKQVKTDINKLSQAIANIAPISSNPGGTNTGAIPTLQQVTKAGGITDQNIIVKDGQNFLVLLKQANAQGGFYVVTQAADGSLVYQTTLLNKYEGSASFTNGVWGLEFELGKEDAYLNAKRLLMPNTGIELSTIIRTQFPTAVNALKGLWGPETDTVTGKTKDVLFDAKKIFSYLRSEIDDWARANNLQQRPSSPGPVGTIYCRPKSSDTTPTTGSGIDEKFFTVTSAQFGVEQAHNFNVPGTRIWPDMITADFQDARSYIKLEFPTNNTFKVTARSPEIAADANFLVNLNLRVKPQ